MDSRKVESSRKRGKVKDALAKVNRRRSFATWSLGKNDALSNLHRFQSTPIWDENIQGLTLVEQFHLFLAHGDAKTAGVSPPCTCACSPSSGILEPSPQCDYLCETACRAQHNTPRTPYSTSNTCKMLAHMVFCTQQSTWLPRQTHNIAFQMQLGSLR